MKSLFPFLARLWQEWPTPPRRKPNPKCPHDWRQVGTICGLVYYECRGCSQFAAECPKCLEMEMDPPILGVATCPECDGLGKVSSDRAVELCG